MSICCMNMADVSLGEKNLKEDSAEQVTAELSRADADMGLNTSSGDKKDEYKSVLFVGLTGTWHCIHTIHTSFHADSRCQGLILQLLVM